jgi:hypothetical protein
VFDWMKNPLNDKRLILMRGLPGSGKSYRAHELANGDETVIYSTDDFFGLSKEEYVKNWKKDDLHKAHRWNQQRVREAMQWQKPLVIVDNTNVRIAEMMPYFDMAVQYQYRVDIEEPTSEWWLTKIAPYLLDKTVYKQELLSATELLWKLNQVTHSVPLEAIQKMLWRYQPMVLFDDLANCYLRNLRKEATNA